MAWSDGNPFYLDPSGEKVYAYHPNHDELALCIVNDSPHVCLACAAEVLVDSRAPTVRCTACGADDLVHAFGLEGRRCPACKVGRFTRDPDFFVIS